MAKTQNKHKRDTAQSPGKPFVKLAFSFGLVLVLFVAMGAGAQDALLKSNLLKQLDTKPNTDLVDRYGAGTQDALLKGNLLKQIDTKPNTDLVDRYGDAANDPAVADVLRKAQGKQTTDGKKEFSDKSEALQNGKFMPGADPTMALMYGFVPPNMSPEQAQLLSRYLPHLPKMPRPLTPEQMAGEPVDQTPMIEPASPYIPYSNSLHAKESNTPQLQAIPQQSQLAKMAGIPNVLGTPTLFSDAGVSGSAPGFSKEEIAVRTQKLAEQCIRARCGPVHVPILQPRLYQRAQQAGINVELPPIVESDHQSVVGVCDASGNEITSIQYDPWGTETVLSGGTIMPTFRYKGMYWHDRSQKYLTLHRAYDPALARWLTRDPLGEAVGTNLYAFVANNPIRYSDPLGLQLLEYGLYEGLRGSPPDNPTPAVWIEGSAGGIPFWADEPPFHQSFNVGDPFGNYYSQSYGIPGAIYTDPMHGGFIERYAPLKSFDQVNQIKKDLMSELGAKPGYNTATNSCRTYSTDKYGDTLKKYGLTETAAPNRPLAPLWGGQFVYTVPSTSTTVGTSK